MVLCEKCLDEFKNKGKFSLVVDYREVDLDCDDCGSAKGVIARSGLPSVDTNNANRAKLKSEILDLFKNNEIVGYYDIISRIDAELGLAVELCDELEKEKQIEVVRRYRVKRRL